MRTNGLIALALLALHGACDAQLDVFTVGIDDVPADQGAAPDAAEDAGRPSELLAHEPFGGEGDLNAASSGFGFTSDWRRQRESPGYERVLEGGLSFPGVRSTAAALRGGPAGVASWRLLDLDRFPDGFVIPTGSPPQPSLAGPGRELWLGALLRRDEPDDGTGFGWGRLNSISAGGFSAMALVVDDEWRLVVGSGDGEERTAIAATLGRTYFLVIRTSFDEEQLLAELFVDPPTDGEEPGPAAAVAATSAPGRFFDRVLFAPATGVHAGPAMTLDEVRIGTSFRSVTGR